MGEYIPHLGRLLDRQEAAGYLRICKTTLDRLGLQKTRIRRRVLFRQSVLDAFLEENTCSGKGQGNDSHANKNFTPHAVHGNDGCEIVNKGCFNEK